MSSNEAFAERVPSSRAFHTTSAAIECRVVQSASTAVECRCTGSGLIKLVKFGTAHDALQTRRIVRMGTQTAFNRTQRESSSLFTLSAITSGLYIVNFTIHSVPG